MRKATRKAVTLIVTLTAMIFFVSSFSACALKSVIPQAQERETAVIAKDYVKAIIERDDEKMLELTNIKREPGKTFHYDSVFWVKAVWEAMDGGLEPYLINENYSNTESGRMEYVRICYDTPDTHETVDIGTTVVLFTLSDGQYVLSSNQNYEYPSLPTKASENGLYY